MWRTTACAAAGLFVALAAAYGLTSTRSGAGGHVFDLSFLYQQRSAPKGDRLPVSSVRPASAFAISYNLPQHSTTVVAKNPPLPVAVSAIRFRRDPLPVQSVKPEERPDVAQKPKLPEGCEPSFSPVTVPALAHVAGRCTS